MSFRNKPSKAEQPDKLPYIFHHPHSNTERKWDQSYYQIISIDPAEKNFAIRIEQRHHSGKIRALAFDKWRLPTTGEGDDPNTCPTYTTATRLLDQFLDLLSSTHFIIIERQLPHNYKAVRLSQHVLTYFLLRAANQPLLPYIIELDSKVKGRELGAPKGLSDSGLKTWSVKKATELLQTRRDEESLRVMAKFQQKRDDLADTVCQIEAVFKIMGLPLTRPPITLKIIPNPEPSETVLETVPKQRVTLRVRSS